MSNGPRVSLARVTRYLRDGQEQKALNVLSTEIARSSLQAAFSDVPRRPKQYDTSSLQSHALAPGSDCEQSTCPICYELMQAGEDVLRLTRCSHVFHAACVIPWLRTASKCPTCRRKVALPEVQDGAQ